MLLNFMSNFCPSQHVSDLLKFKSIKALASLCTGTISIFFDKALLVLVICGKINSKLLLPLLHTVGLCIFLSGSNKLSFLNISLKKPSRLICNYHYFVFLLFRFSKFSIYIEVEENRD